ncbi:hypothetical protein AB6805_29665 [Chitinophaga sp. RCC_12]|uniref:hypothetical protein n=1 Tax=Chitinophaga sp. RCC_12 TaxID=3239226 RepID=UPI00352341E0
MNNQSTQNVTKQRRPIELHEWFTYHQATTHLWRITLGPTGQPEFHTLPHQVQRCFLTFTTLLIPVIQEHISIFTDIKFCSCEIPRIELADIYTQSQAHNLFERMYQRSISLPGYKKLSSIEKENETLFYTAIQDLITLYYSPQITLDHCLEPRPRGEGG